MEAKEQCICKRHIVKTPWLISVACVLDLSLRIYQFFRAVFQNVLKCNIFSLNACEACNFPTETTNHKFYECPAVKRFWHDAFNWWNLKHSENITPSAMEILYTVCRESSVR